jgi:fatty-acyl-CoA synthase/long-chain acyl-CoA synthetase
MYYPELQTLAATSAFHARRQPEHIAVICEQRQTSYGELHRESNRIAHAIKSEGLKRAARVAFLGKDSELYYEILFACAKSETVLVPINWRLTAPEVDYILRDSDAELLFVEQEFLGVAQQVRAALPMLKHVVILDGGSGRGRFSIWKEAHPDADLSPETGPEDPIVQLYTSGTTGLPKGVVLAQRSFFKIRDALAANQQDWVEWQAGDKILIALSGFHVGGLWCALQGFNAGMTNVLLRMFISQEVLALIRQQGITTACLVPSMLQMMLAEPGVSRADFGRLRTAVYGGSPMPESLLQRSMEMIGCGFLQMYGMTETGNAAVTLLPSDHVPGSPRLKAAGRPFPGVRLKIIGPDGQPLPANEIGEICIHSPASMLEYWRLKEATEKTLIDGWIHTGDAGYLDEEGYLFICDRIKDTIIVAGEKVFPAEVESALSKHPAVAEVAVIGVPDERWGEAVHAFVVPRPGQKVSPRELMLSLKGHLADFKAPTRYTFIDKIPRTPSGKILRRTLRDQFWRHMDRQVN